MMAFQFYIWLCAKIKLNFVPFASGVVVVDEVSNAEVMCNVVVVVLPAKGEVSCAKNISHSKTSKFMSITVCSVIQCIIKQNYSVRNMWLEILMMPYHSMSVCIHIKYISLHLLLRNIFKTTDSFIISSSICDKMYCLLWVRVVVEALSDDIADSADDLVTLVVVDDVALDVEISPRTVVSGAEKGN